MEPTPCVRLLRIRDSAHHRCAIHKSFSPSPPATAAAEEEKRVTHLCIDLLFLNRLDFSSSSSVVSGKKSEFIHSLMVLLLTCGFWVWSPFHCGCCKVFHKFVVVVEFYLILFYFILGDLFRFLFLFWFWICCCFWGLNLFFVDSFVLCFVGFWFLR